MEVKDNTIELTKTEALIIARLLEMAGEKFSNHGCNDLPEDFYQSTNAEDLHSLFSQLQIVNGSHNEDESVEEFMVEAGQNDAIMMDLMSHYILDTAESA